MTVLWMRARGMMALGLVLGVSRPADRDFRPQSTAPTATARASQAGEGPAMLLTEVRFDPASGDTAFVELLNTGPAPLDLLRFILQVGDEVLPLPRMADSLAPGARLVVRFDGSGRTEKGVVHAAANFTVLPDSGTIQLLTDDRLPLDRVAWGTANSPVSTDDGGIPPAALERGGSIGRPPGAHLPGTPDEWVVYPPSQVTPGEPNPMVTVRQLFPMDGVVLEDSVADLAWYPVPGAAGYRVQVAMDTSFSRLVADRPVSAPELPALRLALGVYAWRVRALDAQGNVSPWSEPSRLELEEPPSTPERPEPALGGPSDDDSEQSGTQRVLLPVPFLTQHKDSKMLLLESQTQKGPHAWDADHGTPRWVDPADAKNCAVANVAMINHFYRGDLTQDRIGYEVLSRNGAKYVGAVSNAQCDDCAGPGTLVPLGQLMPVAQMLKEVEPGPERDLVFGRGRSGSGLNMAQAVAAFTYALGAAPVVAPTYATKTAFWNDVVAELSAGRPMVGTNSRHAFVIRGFELRGARRFIYVNDPARGRQKIDIDAAGLPAAQLSSFKFINTGRIARLEPEVTQDGDRDGVVDFDELERFRTNPMNPDTDQDGVKDKEDIASGVFEIEHRLGYAFSGVSFGGGRDYDTDNLPTEIDADSDWPAGRTPRRGTAVDGCLDGDEDKNGDGFRQGNETSNFDKTDDQCARLNGVLTYSVSMDNSDPNSIAKHIDEHVVVHVKLKPDPQGSPESYVDDGSTFVFRANAHVAIDLGDPSCVIWANEWISTSGPFDQPNDEIGGTRSDSVLVVGASADRPSQTYANLCVLGSGPGQLERTLTLGGPCEGKLRQSVMGQRRYVFDCTARPSPGMGWVVTKYLVRGYVNVR